MASEGRKRSQLMKAASALLAALLSTTVPLGALTDTSPLAPQDLPIIGMFYSAANPSAPPQPGNFQWLPAWDLGDGNFLLDDIDYPPVAGRGSSRAADGTMHPMDSGFPGLPGGGSGGTPVQPLLQDSFDTNGLWLEVANVSDGFALINLHNATNGVYEILTTTNLAAGEWAIETDIWSWDTEAQLDIPQSGRDALFVRARQWAGIDDNTNGVPDWWEWENLGTILPANYSGLGQHKRRYHAAAFRKLHVRPRRVQVHHAALRRLYTFVPGQAERDLLRWARALLPPDVRLPAALSFAQL